MLINYLSIMARKMMKAKAHAVINIAGLALGITCFLTIFLYVYDELNYDHHHLNYKKIFRLNGGWTSMTDGSSQSYPFVGYKVSEHFKKDFPEVDQIVHVQTLGMTFEKSMQENIPEVVYHVDPQFTDVFTVNLISGNKERLLTDRNSIVLSRKSAMKYFNRVDILGQTLRSFAADTTVWRITGVMEDYPDNTHMKIDFMVRHEEPANPAEDWFEYPLRIFFTLKPNVQISDVEERVTHFTKPYITEYEKSVGFTQNHSITPFGMIHLHSHLASENNPRAFTVYVFLTVGVFVLVMASINFINLATARSMRNAKEIGVRKVVGATRTQLISQFLGEALITTLISAFISIVTVYALMPVVNAYSEKNLTSLTNPVFWSMLAFVVVIVAVLSGSYPAWVISGFKATDTLKGSFHSSSRGAPLRMLLVVFQFVISISLIAGTLIIFDHIKFMRSAELGFSKENVLLIRNPRPATKEAVLAIAGVEHASFSNKVPGMQTSGRTIFNGWNENDQQVVMDQIATDEDYITLYDLKLLEGRGFSKAVPSDQQSFVINEKAASLLGYKSAKDAIGGKLLLEDWGGKKGTIIGVLKDFHYNGVNSPILPFSMFLHADARRFLSVKISSADLPATIELLEEAFKSTTPNLAFEYSFLDQDFDKQYRAEDRFMVIFSLFSLTGILIGCLGLYGLALFLAEQRQKELGIRKVLGATVTSIFSLLSFQFLKPIALSFLIAIPISYYALNQWLSSFPYRENIRPGTYVITGIAVLLITLITVSAKSLRAASKNPLNLLHAD